MKMVQETEKGNECREVRCMKCNNRDKASNKCVALVTTKFISACPFYKAADETSAEDMKYHVNRPF